MRHRTVTILSRKTFLINRDLQYSLLFSSLLYVFLILALLGAALFVPLFVELEKAGGSSSEVPQATAAAETALFLHASFWPAALFSLVLVGLLSIRTSHRIAGPLSKIIFILQSLTNGKVPKAVQVRKDDRLAAEIDAANQMLESLRMRVREIQGAQADMNDAIIECEKMIGQASTEGLIERMHDIREKASRLTDRISYFNVE